GMRSVGRVELAAPARRSGRAPPLLATGHARAAAERDSKAEGGIRPAVECPYDSSRFAREARHSSLCTLGVFRRASMARTQRSARPRASPPNPQLGLRIPKTRPIAREGSAAAE